jgi:hypothetical protein
MKHIEPVKARILMLASVGWSAREISNIFKGKPAIKTIETWVSEFGSTEEDGKPIDLIADLAELFNKYGPNSKEVVAQTGIMLAEGNDFRQKALAASRKASDYMHTMDGEQIFEKIGNIEKLSKLQDKLTGIDQDKLPGGMTPLRLNVQEGMKVVPLGKDHVSVELRHEDE